GEPVVGPAEELALEPLRKEGFHLGPLEREVRLLEPLRLALRAPLTQGRRQGFLTLPAGLLELDELLVVVQGLSNRGQGRRLLGAQLLVEQAEALPVLRRAPQRVERPLHQVRLPLGPRLRGLLR